MKIRRTESTLGPSLRNLGIVCAGFSGIVFIAGARNSFAITKPESIPQDTEASREVPPIGQPLLQNLTYKQAPDNATDH